MQILVTIAHYLVEIIHI